LWTTREQPVVQRDHLALHDVFVVPYLKIRMPKPEIRINAE